MHSGHSGEKAFGFLTFCEKIQNVSSIYIVFFLIINGTFDIGFFKVKR